MTKSDPKSKFDQTVKQNDGEKGEGRKRSLANLRPIRPGEVLNPGGRPKMDPEVKRILEAATPDAARRLVELLQSKDEKVSLAAIDQIFNRVYGRPVQQVDAEVRTTNVQQAHLQILLELQAKRDGAMKTIEGDTQMVSVHDPSKPKE